MLDFHGLFSSVLLLRGTFLRWRLHGNRVLETRFTFKKKKKKKPQGQHQRVHQRRKKKKKKPREERKKKKPETVAQRPGSRCDLGSPGDLDLSRATCVAGLGRLELISISSSSSSLSFFFLSFCVFFHCFCILGCILVH